MNSNEIDIIINKLFLIKDSKIHSIGTEEYGNVWVKFIDEFGKIYILLMRTFFRFCKSEKILITDLDKYQASDVFKLNPDYDEWNYDFKTPDSSILHEWLDNNEEELMINLKVQDIQINIFGDLQIQFNNDITLTVYLGTTNNEECWYFFEDGADKMQDFIVHGIGITPSEEKI